MPAKTSAWKQKAKDDVIAPLQEWDAIQKAEAEAAEAQAKRDALKQYAVKGARLLLKVMEKDPELAGVAKMLGFMLPGAPKDISNKDVVAQLSSRLEEQTDILIDQMERLAEKQQILSEIGEGRRHANNVKSFASMLSTYWRNPESAEALRDLRNPNIQMDCRKAVTWARGALAGEWGSINVPQRIMDASFGDLRLTGRFADAAAVLIITTIIVDTAARTFHADYAETPWAYGAMKAHVKSTFGPDLKTAAAAYRAIDTQLRSVKLITAWSKAWMEHEGTLKSLPGCNEGGKTGHRKVSADMLYYALEEQYPQRDWAAVIFGYCNGSNNQSWVTPSNSFSFKRSDQWADANNDKGGTCIVSHWPLGAPGAKTVDGLPEFVQQVADNATEVPWVEGDTHAAGLPDLVKTTRHAYPGYLVIAVRNKTDGGLEPVPVRIGRRDTLAVKRTSAKFNVVVIGAKAS